MLTRAEIRNRAIVYNAQITFNKEWGEYRVTLNEWRGKEAERKAYYTSCEEDAVHTCADMRRREDALRAKIPVRRKQVAA